MVYDPQREPNYAVAASAVATPTRQWRPFAWQQMHPRDFVASGAFWAMLTLAGLWGLLAPVDGWLFDIATRAVPGASPTSVAVMQVDGRAPSGLVATLRRAGATHVLEMTAVELETTRRVGRFAESEARLCRPPAGHGVLRVLRLHDSAGAPCPLARIAAAAGLQVPLGTLLSPDFSARTSTSIPRLDATGPVDARTLRTAVAGRIVLLVPRPDAPAHVTPLYRVDGLLEPSIPYAMALDGLVHQRVVRWSPPWISVAVAAVAVLLLHLALRRSSFRVTLTVTLLALLPLLLAYSVMLHAGRVHIPAAASVLAILAFGVRTVFRRNRALGDTLVEVDHRLTGIVGQPMGQGFEMATGLVWEHANRFVTGFFDLRRSVMLELPPGGTHLQPVASFGCSAEAIIEKRRDYRRAPFSTALARAHPTPPSRPFLPAEEGVVDLITPLIAADQLVGFWALSIANTPAQTVDAIAVEAERYAGEVAKMILRSGHLGGPDDSAGRQWPTLAKLRARLIDGATRAREQIAAYRDVFSAVGHPIAVCDLLGRVQIANPAFEQFAEASGHPLMGMSATGMLEQHCGLSPGDAKATVRHVVLSAAPHANARLPMATSSGQVAQVLVLRPIVRRAPDTAGQTVTPFDLLGLITEIVPDVSGMADATRLNQAAIRYARRSEAMLGAIARTVDTLGTDAGSKGHLTDMLAGGLDEARELMQHAGDTARRDTGEAGRVDVLLLLQRARQAHARELREKNVELQLPATGIPEVDVAPEPLAGLLRALVALLLDDAAPGSVVEVGSAVAAASTVQLQLRNDGYGMPAWHVRNVLSEGASVPLRPDSMLLERVAHAAAALDVGSGFQLDAELGKGYRATLTLPQAG